MVHFTDNFLVKKMLIQYFWYKQKPTAFKINNSYKNCKYHISANHLQIVK